MANYYSVDHQACGQQSFTYRFAFGTLILLNVIMDIWICFKICVVLHWVSWGPLITWDLSGMATSCYLYLRPPPLPEDTLLKASQCEMPQNKFLPYICYN